MVDILSRVFDILVAVLYSPVFYVYDLLPFSDGLSLWRDEFMHQYFDTYMVPIFVDICATIALHMALPAPLSSTVSFLGNVLAAIKFFSDFGPAVLAFCKAVLGFFVYLIVGLAPYVLPPILMIVFITWVLGLLSIIFGTKKTEGGEQV